ncbi:Conserved_hypothetical protein [Hexamita inflata]|uniref:Uncharacterized protein n=1 Tax=Hexamita inflata TaxID=28002 RepID=A0AA86UVJ3_9EUKA|nr:Conserved hypothetical protein [Hexamita inflata]
MNLYISVLGLKFNELQDKLQNFEEMSISSANIGNIFNSVREILNMKNFTFYDPKLALFRDYQQRTDEYESLGISGSLYFQEAIYVLDFYISIDWTKEWCEDAENRLKSELPDVDQFFYNQKETYFEPYQYELDELTLLASNITKLDTADQIREKIGDNYTYFTINNHEQLSEGVPYTNPMIFSRFSKDTVYIFNNFDQLDVLNTTILETSSLVDRVWIFIVNAFQKINVIQTLFNVKYMSLVQVIIFQQNITDFIKQNLTFDNTVSNFNFIQEIQNEIEDQNKGQTYTIQNGTYIVISPSYSVFFLFTGLCNYISSGLWSNQNRIIVMVSKEQCNYFMQIFNTHIQLFLSYNNETQYRNISLKSIIQYMNQLFYDEAPKFGNVNNTMIFIKPVYIDSIYIGSIYKLIEYTQYLTFSMFSVDKVSRTTILDTKTQRTLIDLFSQYSSAVIIQNTSDVKSFFTLQPISFNQLDININYSDYIQVTKQQVFNIVDNEIFMKTDSVKYQKQFKFKENIAVNTLSSTFLGLLIPLPSQNCAITDQNYIEQYELFHNYISNTKINYSNIRSIASPTHTSISQQCNNKQGCVNDSSLFLNYQYLMKETFRVSRPTKKCQISKQIKFN